MSTTKKPRRTSKQNTWLKDAGIGAAIITSSATIIVAIILVVGPRLFPSPIPSTPTPISTPISIQTPINTSTTSTDPYIHKGILKISDPLVDNSQGNQWDEGRNPTPANTCTFSNGAYHAKVTDASTNPFWPCMAEKNDLGDLSNFVYEVQMQIVTGDQGGIVFRAGANGQLYYFYINQHGNWGFIRGEPHTNRLVKSDSNSAIKTGLYKMNLIAVVAQGSTFTLYINHTIIDNINDGDYGFGRIGLTADDEGNPTEILFTNAKVWTL